ncbi:hypothetical protein C8K44_105252 [Aminobacter sp. AP02]|nr:hypothetical protein C8K44_105252 [Aminobacter sp. AP02]
MRKDAPTPQACVGASTGCDGPGLRARNGPSAPERSRPALDGLGAGSTFGLLQQRFACHLDLGHVETERAVA